MLTYIVYILYSAWLIVRYPSKINHSTYHKWSRFHRTSLYLSFLGLIAYEYLRRLTPCFIIDLNGKQAQYDCTSTIGMGEGEGKGEGKSEDGEEEIEEQVEEKGQDEGDGNRGLAMFLKSAGMLYRPSGI